MLGATLLVGVGTVGLEVILGLADLLPTFGHLPRLVEVVLLAFDLLPASSHLA